MLKNLKGLTEVEIIQMSDVRWQLQVGGRLGWAIAIQDALLIALEIKHHLKEDQSLLWSHRVTLLFYRQPEMKDDALHYWQKKWWLWRRYEMSQSTRKQLNSRLILQRQLVAFLESTINQMLHETKHSVRIGEWG